MENKDGNKKKRFELWYIIVGVYAFLIITKCVDSDVSDSDSECYVEWDGRANPTVCE